MVCQNCDHMYCVRCGQSIVVLKHNLVCSMFEIRIIYTKGTVKSYVTVDLYMFIIYFMLLFYLSSDRNGLSWSPTQNNWQ